MNPPACLNRLLAADRQRLGAAFGCAFFAEAG